MARTYTLKRRAEQQAETRRRIVEAAVELHGSVGPALTTYSMVAERAGVQRHTLYAHFPDERSLFMACSGLVNERDPPPEAAAWRDVEDRRERLAAGLRAVYDWYERNATLASQRAARRRTSCADKRGHQLRFAPSMAAWHEVLGADLSLKQRAVLRLALSFFTWRSLVREGGLEQRAAVEAMVRAIDCANEV